MYHIKAMIYFAGIVEEKMIEIQNIVIAVGVH
jgi:hypothetical protein